MSDLALQLDVVEKIVDTAETAAPQRSETEWEMVDVK
jgi:hypothetical protein